MAIGDFVLHSEEGAFLCKPRRIVDFDGVLKNHFAAQRNLARGAFALGEQQADVAVGQHDCLCAVRLTEISLSTDYEQRGERLVPSFGSGGLRLALTWKPPEDMQLRFACQQVWNGNETPVKRWKMGECFLFARKAGRGGFFRLPLPNTFEDGRICMGDQVRGTVFGPTAQDCFKAALESFGKTTWNRELLTDFGCTWELFRWKPDRTQLPGAAEWWRYCQGISRVEMEELCPQS